MNGKKKSNPCPDINLALVGEIGVGKSALTVKYITKRFIKEYAPFIEDTYVKHDIMGQQDINVHIMDTFDRPESDPNRYLRWADVILVVYSIVDKVSFEKAKNYVEAINQYARTSGRDIPMALVGNKVDLEIYREVSKESGILVAGEFDCLFFETTAAEEIEYVENVFHGIIIEYFRDREMLLNFDDKTGGPHLLNIPQANIRSKSPKLFSADKKDDKTPQRKTSTTSFKLFNKSFKIFN